jgi:hypothetical protein
MPSIQTLHGSTSEDYIHSSSNQQHKTNDMKFRQPNLALASIAAASLALTHAMPVQYQLESGSMECLYAPINQYETVTTSVFITDGDELKVRTKLQGPIAPIAIGSSAEVLAAAMRVDKMNHVDFMNQVNDVDFENLYNDDALLQDDDWDDDDHKTYGDDRVMDDILFQDYYYMDDDDEYQFMEDDAMDDTEIMEIRKARAERDAMSPEERQKKLDEKQLERRKKLEAFKKQKEMQRKRQDEKERKHKQRKLDLEKRKQAQNAEVMPLEHTSEVQEEGWYRFCVEATHSTVSEVFLSWLIWAYVNLLYRMIWSFEWSSNFILECERIVQSLLID